MMGQYTGMDRFVGTNYVQEAARIKLTQHLGNPLLKQTCLQWEKVFQWSRNALMSCDQLLQLRS